MMQEFKIIWLFNLLIMRLPDESIYFQKRVMRTKLYIYVFISTTVIYLLF